MSDLDDFFAKKDKKKTKGKKFLTAEELAKKLEDTSKRATEPPKPKKERPVSAGTSSAEGDEYNNIEENVEDEWKDFEQEERKDYTGLKICQLTITDDDQNQSSSGHDADLSTNDSSDVDSSARSGEKKQFGPWKKVHADENVAPPATNVQANEPEKCVSKVYITPALRNQPPKNLKGRHRDAPDISNEEYFPTLGAARPEEQRKKKNEPAFEEVRHGSRVTRLQEVHQSAPVSIGNRFKSLADDDS